MAPNKICRLCAAGQNRLNGRWCTILDCLVEYAPFPPCDTKTDDNPKTDKK